MVVRCLGRPLRSRPHPARQPLPARFRPGPRALRAMRRCAMAISAPVGAATPERGATRRRGRRRRRAGRRIGRLVSTKAPIVPARLRIARRPAGGRAGRADRRRGQREWAADRTSIAAARRQRDAGRCVDATRREAAGWAGPWRHVRNRRRCRLGPAARRLLAPRRSATDPERPARRTTPTERTGEPGANIALPACGSPRDRRRSETRPADHGRTPRECPPA